MKKPKREKVELVRNSVLRWYGKHKRELRWRTTTDPYEILVSEIMLQQTQVNRVQEKLPVFLRRFPTVHALANASRAEVLHAWHGMGYNNRAIRLREMARIIVDEHHGRIPRSITKLHELPGVGLYTAHAVACFAHDIRVPVVEVNIRRVLSRVFFKTGDPRALRNTDEIWKLADNILPRNAYDWNQALMDLGSTICVARRPLCASCPLRKLCSSRRLGDNKLKIAATSRSKKREPLYDGIPQRIWRGRIVAMLRRVNGSGSISLRKLGASVKPSFSASELPWLQSLVVKLERDGIVDFLKPHVRLSLK